MGCQHLEDDYELYLLGSIAGGEPADLKIHLSARCPTCLEGLREAAESLCWLIQTAETVRPRPVVRSRLLARLESGPQGVHSMKEPARPKERPAGARKR